MTLRVLLRLAGRAARPSNIAQPRCCVASCVSIRRFSASRTTFLPVTPEDPKELLSADPDGANELLVKRRQYSRRPKQAPREMRHAFIALGSNLGNRVEWIEIALQMLDCEEKVQILQTSSLWETKAMYVEDQPPFLNGACEIITTLHADHLMATLKRIENKLGREKTVDKGPRNIDLDLLLYGQEFIYRDQEMVLRDEKHLTHKDELFVPHLRMVEREFVLRPMCQLCPGAPIAPERFQRHENQPGNQAWKWWHMGLLRKVANAPGFPKHLRKKLVNSTNGINPQSCLWKLPKKGNQMLPYTPLKRYGTSLTAQSRTHIMAILNLTPDSFSDGGQNLSSDPTSPEYLSSLRSTILSHITSGATIIDIGGQSTRPNAPMVSAEEELSRILPAISLIKSLPEAANTIISIDTFRAFVARAAISAGADLINDVSAGTLDPDMLPTVADLNCSICLMHMRGTPETMTTLTDYPDGVVQTVGDELLERVRAAEEAGIRRWRIILDPGIGFAKTAEQNIELLRGLSTLMTRPSLDSFPWLIGTSRKGFIGKITAAPEPKDRVMGTAVTATQAVNAHANIIRVHDVKPIVETVAMAEALRSPRSPVRIPAPVLPLRMEHLHRVKTFVPARGVAPRYPQPWCSESALQKRPRSDERLPESDALPHLSHLPSPPLIRQVHVKEDTSSVSRAASAEWRKSKAQELWLEWQVEKEKRLAEKEKRLAEWAKRRGEEVDRQGEEEDCREEEEKQERGGERSAHALKMEERRKGRAEKEKEEERWRRSARGNTRGVEMPQPFNRKYRRVKMREEMNEKKEAKRLERLAKKGAESSPGPELGPVP